MIWEDSQFSAMIIHGPNARRDFHDDPSDEIFYMLKGDMPLEYIAELGAAERRDPRGRAPPRASAHPTRAAPPGGQWGLVIERKRGPQDEEALLWYCDRCNAELHA